MSEDEYVNRIKERLARDPYSKFAKRKVFNKAVHTHQWWSSRTVKIQIGVGLLITMLIYQKPIEDIYIGCRNMFRLHIARYKYSKQLDREERELGIED